MTRLPLHCALGALFLLLAFPGASHAACEWSDRITLADADCLDGGWNNQSWPKKDTA